MDQIPCILCSIKKQALIHILMLPDKIKTDMDFTENIYNLTREKVKGIDTQALCSPCTKDMKIVQTFRKSCLYSETLMTQISSKISDNHRILIDDVFIDVTLYEGLDETYVSPMNVVDKSAMNNPPEPEERKPDLKHYKEESDAIVYDPIEGESEQMEITVEGKLQKVVKPRVVFNCDKCKKKYFTLASLDVHRFKSHKIPIPVHSKPRTKVDVNSVKDIYYGVDLTKDCEYCFQECRDKNDLKSHIETAHKELPRKYTCKVCLKELKTKDTLRTHFLMLHTDDRREFKCDHCGKTFYHKRSLQSHEAVHHLGISSAKFICDICGHKSNSGGDLKKHKLRHEKIKPHECPYKECGKRFSTKYQLTLHSRYHENLRTHKCIYCERCFVTKSHLDDHLQCHLKEKKYLCDHCDNAFSRKRSLDKHLKVHYGIRDFLCNLCPYKCQSTDQLNQHKKVHQGFRPFSCLMCTMAFKDIGPLKRHLTITHGINAKKDDDLDYQKTM